MTSNAPICPPLIAGLISKGYLYTKAKDGRSQALSLTRTGRSVYLQAQKIVQNHEQHFFAALSKDERQQLSRLLIQVWRNQSAA